MFKRKENQDEKLEYIIKEFLDNKLNCTICQKPKSDQKQCEKCFSLFCEQCITQSLSQYPFCPTCKAVPLVLKKLNPILQASYELILLNCPNKDCKEIITTSTFDYHKKVCQYLEIPCTNLNCDQKVQRIDLDKHLQKCEKKNKSSKCPRCSQSFEKNERHDCLVNYQQLLKSFTDEKTHMQKLVISTQILLSNMLFTSQIIKSKINQSNQIKKNGKLCSNKHNLQWVRSIYDTECFKCKDNDNIVRYICQQCNEYYCQSCVKPTFNVNLCPANHKMEYKEKASASITCDFCRERPYDKEIGVYMDRQCNFDICKKCFITLSYDS